MSVQFDPGTWKMEGFGTPGLGKQDLDAAIAGNLGTHNKASQYNLWQLHDRAKKEGWEIGDKFMKALGTRPKAPITYGDHGYWGFGMEDIKHLKDLDKVQEAKRWAQQNNVMIGGDVDNWILDEKERIFQDKLTSEFDAKNTERDKKQKDFFDDITKTQQDHQAFMEAEQKKMHERMARVRTSTPQGVGSAAAFRGSRLNTSTVKGGGGTQRFSRVTKPLYMNPLGGVAGQAKLGSGGLTA